MASSAQPTTLTHPHPAVWQIALTSPPDNRLTPVLLSSFFSDLDTVEAEWRQSSGNRDDLPPLSDQKSWGENKGAGAVIITGHERFFSNGLDYTNANRDPRFFEDVFDPVFYRLLTFPLATIAAINGHAFAGGMVLALACDFRLITSGKGLMCMNELAFGSPIPNSFGAILRLRIPHPPHLRDTLLAKRWTQSELKEAGLVDEIVDPGKLLSSAVERGVKEGVRVRAGAWGLIRETLYHEVKDASQSNKPVLLPMHQAMAFWERVGKQKAKL